VSLGIPHATYHPLEIERLFVALVSIVYVVAKVGTLSAMVYESNNP